MGDSYIPLLANRFDVPLLLFGCRTPQLEFLGCPYTHSDYDTVCEGSRDRLSRPTEFTAKIVSWVWPETITLVLESEQIIKNWNK